MQSQLDAIQQNVASLQPPQIPGQSDFLSDQVNMMNATKASEEYDPEELYDPAENL